MEAIPWDEGATGLLYSYYYTIIDEGAHRSELWLGDIPAEFGTLKKLSCLLWETTPHGVQQPRVKRLVRKGYRRGAGGGGGAAGGGDEKDWLGYAILSFDSPAAASEALTVMDGLAATDSFTFRVKPAEADKKALARAQKARAAGLKPGQDPALSAQLFPLDRTAIVRQLELLTAAATGRATGRATGGTGGMGGSTGTTGGNRGSTVDAIHTSESGRGVGDADGADGADGSCVGDAGDGGGGGGTDNNNNEYGGGDADTGGNANAHDDDNDDDGVGSMRFRFKNRKEALAALLDWYGERPRKDSPGVGFKVPESLLGPLRHQLVSMEWPLELRRLTSESYIVLNFAATAEAAVKAATTGEVTAEAPAKAPLAPPPAPRADDVDGGDGEVISSLVAAENLLRGRNSVHLKGFGDGMTPVYYLQDALALILPYDTVVWDGDPLKAGGFTALVEVYLAAHPVGIAVAFKPRNAVNAFLHSWQGVISRYPGRVKVVPVDIRTVTDAFGLHDEVAQSCALLPDWARDYYTLGRAAIKVSGSAKVVSLGGGGIAAREAAAGIREGASWTVFAMGRGKKESHASLCDMAAAHPHVVTLIRGKDPDEALAFSGDCPSITRTRQDLGGLVGIRGSRHEGDGGDQKTDQKWEAVRVPSVVPSVLEQAAAAAEAVAESPPSPTVVVAAGGRGGGVSLSGRFPVLEGNVLPLLRKAIAGCDNFVERDFGDYVSFDYKNATPVAFPDPWEPGRRRKARERWMLAARRECRGLLVSSSTGEVLARRFHKFFNVNETNETAEDRLNLADLSGVTVAAKLDGSLSSPFLRHCDYASRGGGSADGGGSDGRVVTWATRGAVSDSLTEYVRVSMVQDDECAAGAGGRRARGYDALAHYWLGERRKTPLFEWCEAGTTVGVIHHQRSSLLLLAVRDNATGEYLPRAELEDTALEFNVPLAGIVSLVPPMPTRGEQGEQGKHDEEDDSGGNKRDLAWLLRSVNALDDQSEGVVLYLPDNQTMFKVKTGRDERRLEKSRVVSYSVCVFVYECVGSGYVSVSEYV